VQSVTFELDVPAWRAFGPTKPRSALGAGVFSFVSSSAFETSGNGVRVDGLTFVAIEISDLIADRRRMRGVLSILAAAVICIVIRHFLSKGVPGSRRMLIGGRTNLNSSSPMPVVQVSSTRRQDDFWKCRRVKADFEVNLDSIRTTSGLPSSTQCIFRDSPEIDNSPCARLPTLRHDSNKAHDFCKRRR
jgi:hypothetical protein